MEPRISIITLGVADLEKSYKFYHEGLGMPTTRKPESGVIFFQTSGTCLALYPFDLLADDISPDFPRQKLFSQESQSHTIQEKKQRLMSC